MNGSYHYLASHTELTLHELARHSQHAPAIHLHLRCLFRRCAESKAELREVKRVCVYLFLGQDAGCFHRGGGWAHGERKRMQVQCQFTAPVAVINSETDGNSMLLLCLIQCHIFPIQTLSKATLV